jgi:hypothetical protein
MVNLMPKKIQNSDYNKDNKNAESYLGKFKFKLRLFDSTQPLALPKGSIRAIIALLVLCSALYCYINQITVTETFDMLIVTVVTLYFGGRMNFTEKK